jgi:fibronectin-binding autotransporter adhesin
MNTHLQRRIVSTALFARLALAGAIKTMAALAAAAALLAATRASAQNNGTDTWVDNGTINFGDPNWTGANNPPISGDFLVFGSAGASGTTLNNNLLAFTSFAGITFNGPSAFTLTNDAITLTGGLTNLGSALETINFPIASTAVEPVTLSGGGSLTLGGSISGTGAGINLTGAATLTLSGADSFTGNLSVASNSTLTIAGAGYLGGTTAHVYTGAIANAGTINYNTSGNQTNTGIISGIGGLVVNGPGTLTLDAAPNTYSGPTTINGGIVQVLATSGGNGIVENSAITINAGGEMDININDGLGYSISLPVTNYGIIKKIYNQSETLNRPIYLGGGSLVTTLTNTEQFETFGGFVATLPNTTNFVTGPGRFGLRTATCYISNAANSALTFAVAIDQNTAGAPLNKLGTGTLILTATNIFTGNIVISNGTLAINGTGNLGSGLYAGLITNYGTLSYNSSANQLLSGSVTNAGAIIASGTGSLVISGAISGSGTVNQSGPGALLLSGPNTYTGATTVSAGKLVVSGAQPNTNAVIVTDGGTLSVAVPGTTQYSPVSLALGSSAGATLQLGLTSTTSAPLTPATLTLVGHNNVVLAGNLAAGSSYPILSSTLSGSGTLGFALPNGVLGNVASSVNAGVTTYTLTVTSVTPTLWTGANNGTWDINTTPNWKFNGVAGNYLDGSPVQFDDTGLSFVVTNFAGATVSPSTIFVNNSVNNYSFSNSIAIAGTGGITKSGTASLTNFTANTYTGPTVINAGSLVAGVVSSAFGLNSAVSLANVASANLNLNGFTTEIGSLSGGGATGGNVTLGAGTLAAGGDGSSQTYAGVISGTGGFIKAGNGNLTLTGVNSFTGAIGGIAGTLTIGGAGYLSGTTANTYAGTILNNGVFNYSSSATETNTGIMSGIGSLVVNGPGTLASGAAPHLYSGPTTLNGGILLINSASGGNGFAENSIVTINAGGELDLNASDCLGYSLSLPLTNSGIIKKLVNQAETIGRPIYLNGGSLVTTLAGDQQFELFNNFVATLAGTSNAVTGPGSFGLRTASCYFNVAANSSLTFFVPIIQNGNGSSTPLNQYGPGTLNLTAVNTFGGPIFNSNGTMNISGSASLNSGSYAGNINNLGIFNFTSSASQTLSGTIISNQAGATMNFSGSGTLTVSAPIRNNGTLIDGGAAPAAMSGGIIGTGTFEVIAAGASLTLSGTNTYTGPTVISGAGGVGTLFMSGAGSITTSSTITITNGGVLDGSALTGGVYTMGTGQVLIASNAPGTYAVNGSVATVPGSGILPGGSGIAGTLTFNNGLTLANGTSVSMDLAPKSAADGGNNDEIIVDGALAIGSGNTISVNTLNGAANLDTNSDYVLISAPGGISGGFISSPLFLGTPPANFAHFTITNDLVNKQVRLTYSTNLNPTISASSSATPSTGVVAYQPVLFTVTAVPGSFAITSVGINLANIGGTGTLPLVLSGTTNVWTNTVAIPPGVTPGVQSLLVTVTDASGHSGNGFISFTVVAAAETWIGAGTNENFDTATNWGVYAPGYIGDSLIFAGNGGTAGPNPNVDNNYSVSGISFSSGATNFNLGTSNGSTLALAGSPVVNNSSNAQTFSVPVNLTVQETFNTASGNILLSGPVSDTGTGLIQTGTNTLTLTGTNTFTGPIGGIAGTLTVGGLGTLGSGAYANSILDNGTFNYTSASNQTITGNITGTGGLTLNGAPGTVLTLGSGGVSTLYYRGATVVNGGTLMLDFENNGTAAWGLASNSSLTVNNGGTVQVVVDNDLEGSAAAVGTGPIFVNVGGVITGTATADGGAGNSSHVRGVLTLNGGTLAMNGTGNLAYGSWDLDDAVSVPGTSTTTSTISAPAVIPSATGGTPFNITNGGTASGIDLNVTGTLIDGTSLADTGIIKNGNGTMALAGVNTYIGATTINGGTLMLSGSGQLANGAYAAAIVNNATFIDASSSSQTLSGVVSGTGTLEVNGSGVALTLSAANTYTGPTIISGGTLYLTGTGSISASPSITVGSGGTFDVSQTTSEYLLASGQSLLGIGAVNGLLGVNASSLIAPGTTNTTGTLTFYSGLDMSGGGAASFGLSTTYNGNNDQIVVDGALTLNGNVIHISAPSTNASLATNSDYILMTSSGITGSANSIPVFDVKPVNYRVFLVQNSGNNVVLHYSPNAPPTGTGAAVPNNNVLRNQTVALAVNVTSSSSPIASVVVAVGGSQLALVQSNGTSIYTNALVVPPSTLPGLDTLTATITDQNNITKSVLINFVVVSSAETWSGAGALGAENWDNNTNWAVETGEKAPYAPGYTGDSLVFAGNGGTAGLNPNMDNNYTVNGLTFAAGASPFIITSPGNTTLTLTSGSDITNASANVEMLNVPVVLSGNVTIGGKVTIGPAGLVTNGPTVGTIEIFGTFDYDSANNSTLSSLISGTGSLTLDGTGDLTLTNNDTYSGGTIVNNGTLTLTVGGAAGTIIDNLIINTNGTVNLTARDAIGYTVGECVSNLVINGGTFNMINNAGYSTVVNMTGGTISDTYGTGALFNFANGYNLNTLASSSNAVISAGIDIRGTTLTITTAAGTAPGGADLIVSGIINNSNNTAGVGGLIKAGPGTAVFQGYNTYPGPTTLAGGTLQADAGENAGTSGPLGANQTAGALIFAGGTLQYSDQNQFDYSARFSTAANQPISIDTSNQSITFETPLTSVGGSLTKLGLGILTLEAANTYSGNTTVQAGTLALGNGSSLASSSSIVIGAGAILDVTGLPSYSLGSSASLTASGAAARPAAINGNSGEVISLGSSPIILNFDGADPALTILQGALSLNGNTFTINGSQLPVGSYTIVTQAVGTITSAGTYKVNGTAVGASQASIAVSGGKVVLTITSFLDLTPFNFGYSVSGSSLNFTWPASYKGWTLQSNSITLANTNDWFNVAGSAAVTNISVTINSNGPAVFFRLQAP